MENFIYDRCTKIILVKIPKTWWVKKLRNSAAR